MAGLSDFEKLLPKLSPGERAQILKWVVQQLGDSFPGIDSRLDGRESPLAPRAGIARGLSDLRAEDLVNAWASVRSHAAEIEAQIAENEAAWLARFCSHENIALPAVLDSDNAGHEISG
jgi:hypothetical protein